MTTLVDRRAASGRAVVQHARPDEIAVALDDRVRGAEIARLFGKQRRVNTPEDHDGAGRTRLGADLIPTQDITGMNPNADNIASRDDGRIQ